MNSQTRSLVAQIFSSLLSFSIGTGLGQLMLLIKGRLLLTANFILLIWPVCVFFLLVIGFACFYLGLDEGCTYYRMKYIQAAALYSYFLAGLARFLMF